MSKFTNTDWNSTVKSIVDSNKNLMKSNPFYVYNDKKHTIVDWYQINEKMSSIDEGSKTNWEVLGPNSPFRFDEIKDMALYGGFDKIELQLSNNDFGVEVEPFGGTSYIIPDTIVPIPNCLFKISYIDKEYLFIVTDVNPDTIESGANVYKIEWTFWRINDNDWLKNQTINKFILHMDNIGTEYKSIIESDEFDSMKAMDTLCTELKDIYIDIFFNKRIQNFSYRYMYGIFYDQYLLEFIIRNKLLKGSTNYIYLNHDLIVDNDFIIQYNKTIYNYLERKIKPKDYNGKLYGVFIDKSKQTFSMISNEIDNFYTTEYCNGEYKPNHNLDKDNFPIFNLFNEDLYDRINSGKLYDRYDNTLYYKTKLNNIHIDTKHELYKCKIDIIKNINNELLYKNKIYILKEIERVISYECMIDILRETNLDFKSTLNVIKSKSNFYKSSIININNINQLNFKSELNIKSNNNLLLYKSMINIYKKLLDEVSYKFDINIPKYNANNNYKSTVVLYKDHTINSFKYKFNIPIFNKTKEYKSSIINKKFNQLDYISNFDIINLRREDMKTIYNLIIKYFNDIPISKSDIDNIYNIIYDNNYLVFYFIPIIIFIFESLIIGGLTEQKGNQIFNKRRNI